MAHLQDKINTDSQDYKEEQVSLNLSSNCRVSLVKAINMTQLCNSSIKILKVHDSQIILNKEMAMQAAFRIRSQILLPMESFNQKDQRIVEFKIKMDKTNITNILKGKLRLNRTVTTEE